MSSCNNSINGKPKVKHNTKASAYAHLDRVQPHTIHQYQVYRCYHCRFWHIGRKSVNHKKQNYDDVLVGKLIAALKVVINRQPYYR